MTSSAETIVTRAAETSSSTVVVLRDGGPEVEWWDAEGPRPLELMSVTKMVAGLVLGAAIGDEEDIFDEALVRWFPEWQDTEKQSITVGDLVTHKTGLASHESRTVYQSPDTVKLALESSMIHEAGQRSVYNNSSVQLISGLVQRDTGKALDDIADEHLFRPLGFGDWVWQRDDAGNPLCMAGLNARGDDIAKLGQLLLNGGAFGDNQLLPRIWAEATGRLGILCLPRYESMVRFFSVDLIARWREVGVSKELTDKAEGMADIKVPEDEFIALLHEHLGADWAHLRSEAQQRGLPALESEKGQVIGFGHDGDLGQHLAILPEKGIVAVRQRDYRTRSLSNCEWSNFPGDVWNAF